MSDMWDVTVVVTNKTDNRKVCKDSLQSTGSGTH